MGVVQDWYPVANAERWGLKTEVLGAEKRFLSRRIG